MDSKTVISRSFLLHDEHPDFFREQMIGARRLQLVPVTLHSERPLFSVVQGLVDQPRAQLVSVHDVFRISSTWGNDAVLTKLLCERQTDTLLADLIVLFPVMHLGGQFAIMLWRKRSCYPNPAIERIFPEKPLDFTHCYVALPT